MLAKLFPRNIHPVERVLRVLIGIGILALAFAGPETPWGYIGLAPIATGLIGSCPVYTLLGFSTLPKKNPA